MDSRLKAAKNEEMEVNEDDGQYTVKQKYDVNPIRETCTCPDYEYRNVVCKHIHKVKLEMDIAENPTPPKPEMLSPKFVDIPAALRVLPHWVGWKQKLHQNKDGSKRWTKVPVDLVNGGFAKSTGPETWADITTALIRGRDSDLAGIGFVVSDDDDIIGVDFDDCRNPETGEIFPEVEAMVEKMDSYTEISPSGTGLRTFVSGKKEFEWNQQNLPKGAHIEVYDSGRYLTVTGHKISAKSEIKEISSDELEAILTD